MPFAFAFLKAYSGADPLICSVHRLALFLNWPIGTEKMLEGRSHVLYFFCVSYRIQNYVILPYAVVNLLCTKPFVKRLWLQRRPYMSALNDFPSLTQLKFHAHSPKRQSLSSELCVRR